MEGFAVRRNPFFPIKPHRPLPVDTVIAHALLAGLLAAAILISAAMLFGAA